MRRFGCASLFALLLACTGATGAGDAGLTVPAGFILTRIATVSGARELAFGGNGDLIVGTDSNDVYVVPDADGRGDAGTPRVFAHFDDAPAAGVTIDGNALYVGTQFAVWQLPYRFADRHASQKPRKIASVRTSGDSRDHATTSVAVAKGVLYASVGASCNACEPEVDSTRATIGRVEGGKYAIVAKRIRNAIALTTNVNTGALWAGDAGEDDLPNGHPYETFDDVSAHPQPVDYGWPYCYENRKQNPVARWSGHDCSNTAVARVVFPAYATPIGAAFYPDRSRGKYAFPKRYAGGAFVTLHGSWHGPGEGLSAYVAPIVVFVPMHADMPDRAVDWNDPKAQWTPFVSGYQAGGSDRRSGRPTGVAVGPQGDLFVADDLSGAIYRIRPITH